MANKRIPVDVVRVDEPWAVAHLADGTMVKVKVVFDQVYRMVDERGQPCFAPNGQPIYEADFNPVFACNAPDAAKAKVKP